jgi:hypothetical protein
LLEAPLMRFDTVLRRSGDVDVDLVSREEAALLARDKAARPFRQAFVVVLDGGLSRADVANRVAAQIAGHPRWRCVPTGWPAPVWTADAGFNLLGHVREAVLAKPETLESWLAARLAAPSDRSHPLWELWLLRLPDLETTALVCLSHPAQSGPVQLLSALLDTAPAAIPAATMGPVAAVDNPFEPLAGIGRGLHAAFDTASNFAGAEPRKLYVAGIQLDWLPIPAIAAANGCAVHDVLVSLVGSGLASWRSCPGDIVALVPMAVSTQAGRSQVGKNVYLPLTEPDAHSRLLNLASLTQTHIASGIAVGAGELREISVFDQHADASFAMLGGGNHQLYVSNAPGPSGELYFGPRRVRGISAFTAPMEELASVGITRYGNQVTFAIAATSPLEGFGRGMMNALAELRRTEGG